MSLYIFRPFSPITCYFEAVEPAPTNAAGEPAATLDPAAATVAAAAAAAAEELFWSAAAAAAAETRAAVTVTALGRSTCTPSPELSGEQGLPMVEPRDGSRRVSTPDSLGTDLVRGLLPANDEKPRPPANDGPFGCRSTEGGVPRPELERSLPPPPPPSSVLLSLVLPTAVRGRNPVETAGCLCGRDPKLRFRAAPMLR